MSTGGIQESSTRQLERVCTTVRLVGGGGGAVSGGREKIISSLRSKVSIYAHIAYFQKHTRCTYKLLILQLAMFTYNNVRCGVTECRITSLVVAHGNRTFHIGCGSGMLQCVSVQTHQNKYKHTPAIYCLYKAPSLPGLSPRHQLDQAIPSPPISIETLPNKVLRITRQQAHRVSRKHIGSRLHAVA